MLSPPQLDIPELSVAITKVTRQKRATAQIRGGVIDIHVPKGWSKASQQSAIQELSLRLKHQFERDWELCQSASGPFLNLTDKKLLIAWIEDLNRQTLNVPLAGIRMGSARYTRLAQMNCATRVMTVSRFCLMNVPESALRYLIVHELSHIRVPNHSPAFWAEVRRFVPDYRHQQRLMEAIHRMRLFEDSLINPAPQTPIVKDIPPVQDSPIAGLKQLFLNLFQS